MFNMLIVSNDFKFVKRLTNNVIGSTEFIRISGIVSTYEEMADFMIKKDPNILVLSEDIFRRVIIELKDVSIFTHAFIVLTDDDREDDNTSTSILYIQKSLPSIKFNTMIKTFIRVKNNDYIKRRITVMLKNLGFNMNSQGTKFLIESVFYCYVNKYQGLEENLEGNVYPYVAKKFLTHIENVKCYIIRSINHMYSKYEKTSVNRIADFFEIDYFKKPTSRIVISAIVDKLDIEENAETIKN